MQLSPTVFTGTAADALTQYQPRRVFAARVANEERSVRDIRTNTAMLACNDAPNQS